MSGLPSSSSSSRDGSESSESEGYLKVLRSLVASMVDSLLHVEFVYVVRLIEGQKDT